MESAAQASGPGRRTVVGGGLAAVVGTAVGGALLPQLAAPAAAQGHPAAAGAAAATGEPADIYEELLRRWRDIVIGGELPEGEFAEMYAEAVAAQDRSVTNQLDTLITDDDAATPWEDLPLDEEDALSANVSSVASRLRGIAVAYGTEASRYYQDEDVAARAAAGCRVWWRARYHAGQAQYGNWWDWEIGSPRSITDTLTLLGPAVDEETREGILDAIDHFVPDPRRMLRDELWSTGANLVDLCRVVALRGALGKNDAKLQQGSSSLAGVLDPVHVGDGFFPDGSFIMHTSVAYPGTYGQVLVKGMAEMMRLLVDTDWDVAENERRRTTESIDQTFAPFVHQGLMLDAVRGRAIARHNAADADDGFKLTIDLITLAGALPDAEAEDAARLRAVAKDWLLRNDWRDLGTRQAAQIATAAAVLSDDSITPQDGPVGYFGFPDMERFVLRRPGWTYCLSLNSDRVARYEYMNGENAHGWHTGDGMAQLILDSDRFQYTDAYWPTADPKRLPGITVDTSELPVGAGGDNDNVPLSGTRRSGQVRLDDFGLVGMDFRGVESPLRAKKSWLLLDDAVLCAGSGIQADDGRHIETVVDHRSLHDPDSDPEPGELRVDGRPVSGELGQHTEHSRPGWAHLSGTGGYVFLNQPGGGTPETLLALREDRTGAWSDIRDGGPDAPVTRRFVTLWHDHGQNPDGAAYAHLQLPGASFATTASRAAYPGVEVLELSEAAHAFRTTPGALPGRATLTAVNFFEAGTAGGITVDGPCAVLVKEHDGTLRVAVSDPSRTAPVVRVTLGQQHRYRSVVETGDGVTVLSATRDGIDLLVETGGSHGASRTATLGSGRPAAQHTTELLTPTAAATVRAGRWAGTPDGGDKAEERVHHADEADDTSRICLRFPLPDSLADGELTRAVLWVYGAIPKDPDSRESDMLQHQVRASGPATGSWDESDVTWNTAPSPGEPQGQGWITTYPDWAGLEIDGALTVDESGEVSFVLDQRDVGYEMYLHGRGGDQPPRLQLVVRYGR